MSSAVRHSNHRRSSTHQSRSKRWLVLLSLLLSLYALACTAVNVGDDEDTIRLLQEDEDDSSGSSDEDVSCPDVTTLAMYSGTSSSAKASNTSAQIVDPDSCRSVVVSSKQVQDKDTGESVYELDVRKRDIRRVVGIPSAVRILRLDNNTVESFRPGRSAQNTTTHIYLSNNSIETLDDFVFPSSLLTLDLTDNKIVSIDNVSFPAQLTMLNLTLNPIDSLQFAVLPPKLQYLNVAGGSLDRLENFSFPNSLLSLNFSTNPITRIAGVIFPSALNRLVINAGYASAASAQTARKLSTNTTTTEIKATALSTPLLFAKPVVSLEEFEVRRTDAERFQKLALFDVSATSSVKCSDPLAKHFFVNDTMLCVLSDDDFIAKYASVAQAASITDGTILVRKNTTQQAKELPLLHETWRQSRSWFLLVSALILLGLVVVMGVCSCCHASVRRVNGAYTNRKSELAKSSSAVNSRSTDMDALEKGEKETESLLSNSQEETVDDETTDVNSSSDDFVSDALSRSFSQKLEAFLIAPSRLEFPSSLPRASLMDPESRRKKLSQQASQFIYTLASLRNQVVVLKTLRLRDSAKPKKVEFESNRGGISRGCTLKIFSREIQLHSVVTHVNIVSFIGYLQGGPFSRDAGSGHDRAETLTLVTEYMNMGTLDNFIEKQKVQLQDALILQRTGVEHITKEDEEEDGDSQQLLAGSIDIPGSIRGLHIWGWHRDSPSCKSKLSVAIDIARALVYLHSFSPSLFHGNFSSRKVLLDDSWHIKLNDLSCSSALLRWSERQLSVQASESSSSSSQVEAQEEVQMDMTMWTAPEVIDGQQYTAKADMYSFGILLSYLDTYEFPVDALHRVDSEVAILSSSSYNVIPMIGARSPISIRMLTMQCISFQPEDRPSAEEALNELLTIQMDLKEMSSSSELAD